MQRRHFIRGLAGLSAAAAAPGLAQAMMLTPRQSAGPFYPPGLPLDNDNDLVHVAGQESTARGEIVDLGGRLLDRNGKALPDLRIEIWQCDANGRYRHPRDPGQAAIDPGFQGIGHATTDEQGRYRFLTIRPVPYPGRTPHIHVAVFNGKRNTFVTQLYVAGESRNTEDFLYQRIAGEKRPLVTAEFNPTSAEGLDYQANWDIILNADS